MKTPMICLALFAFLLSVAPTGAGESPKSEGQVTIDNFSFIPETLTVNAGATVTWVNKDDVPHKVVSIAREFSSQVMDTDDRYSHTFTAPGSYEYYCSVHPHMKGKVIVEQGRRP